MSPTFSRGSSQQISDFCLFLSRVQASDAVSHMYAIRLLTTSSERKCALKNQELRIASLNKMCSSLDEGGMPLEVQGVSLVGF